MDPRIEKVLKLPKQQRIIILVGVLCLEAAALLWGLYLPKQKEYKALTVTFDDLQKKVEENRRVAANLPKFRRDYEQLNLDLEKALTELPNQKEIPSLLTSITGAGKAAGLEFLSFKPRSEEPKDFYAAVPVDITVLGSYYNVANFFVAVGDLPRIVNISNVAFSDIKQVGPKSSMKVTCLATTFRFMDKKEIKNEKKPK